MHAFRTQRVAELCVTLRAHKCLDLFPAPTVLDSFALGAHRRNPLEGIDPLIGAPQLRLCVFQLAAPLECRLKSGEEQVDDLQAVRGDEVFLVPQEHFNPAVGDRSGVFVMVSKYIADTGLDEIRRIWLQHQVVATQVL